MDKEILKLKADILRFKSVLYDDNTSLPILNAELDNIKKMLTREKKMCCVYVTIGKENMLEQIYGWESYDEIIRLLVGNVKECISHLFIKPPIIVMSSIKGDGIFIFFSEWNAGNEITEQFVDYVIKRIKESISNVKVGNDLSKLWKKALFYFGYKIFSFEPIMRIERTIYQATEEARFSAYFKEKKREEKLLEELANIILRKEVKTYFQPIYDLKKEEIFGYEALSRGPLHSYFFEPDILFSLASKYQYLNDLETLCISNTLNNIDKIQRDKRIFINVTPNFLPYLTKERKIRNFLEDINDKKIVFEITEKFVIFEAKIYINFINKLKDLGFEIALDDVGTGYSTLERIAEIRPKYLKYDKTLIKNVSNDLIRQELLRTMLDFSKKIDSVMIAEGIENEEDLEFLKDIGITP